MSRLSDAADAAEARKRAVFGDAGNDGPEIAVGSEDHGRAVVSGFDIDYDEFIETMNSAAEYFHGMARQVGLSTVFSACWVDAFLLGLFTGSLPASKSGGTDATGQGG